VRHFIAGLAAAVVFSASSSAQSLKYQSVTTFSTGSSSPVYIAAGDFNGDGKPDIAVPDYYGKTISVYLNRGDGTFGVPVVTSLNIPNTLGAILVGDINEDGKQDLIVSTVAGSQFAIPMLGQGDGTFSQQPGIANSFGFLSGKLADFNGDGHLDLFLGGDGEPYLFMGKGDGTFTQQSIPNGSFPGDYFSAAVGDLNGDKLLDAVGGDYGDPGNQGGSIDVFPANAGGGFGAPSFLQASTIANPQTVELADFNHDGKLDLLVAGNGGVFVAPGNGDGTFQLQPSQLILISATQLVGVSTSSSGLPVDLNQDGQPDVAALDGTGGVLTLVLNDGTGTFPNALNSPYVYQLAANSFRIITADFNGDGLPDFAVSNSAGKFVSMLLSSGLPTPIISIASSGNVALVGSMVSLQVKVNGIGKTPTGTVTFMDGATKIGTQQLDTTGSATITTSSLGAGVHSLVANYPGDSNYNPVSSPALSESITDFQVSLAQSSQTVTAGASATYAMTVTPVAGFSGEVTLTCSGLPALAQCGSATANVTSGPTNVKVVVSTAAAASAQNHLATKAIYYCVLFGAFSFCYASRKRRGIFAGSSSVLVIALAVGLSGCGGGSKGSSQPGTPSGTTSFTITASTTQSGTTVTHTSKATLVVQ
jgi:hypothetical protein